MSSIKENEMQKFPDVPDCVHQAVLDALKKVETISEQEKEIAPKRGRHYKKRVILLAAAIMTIFATTAFAAELFSWNKRAVELFDSSKELQDKLVEEEIAKDEYASVTENGLTIRAIQTIQDANCFYALFEVESDDPSVLLDENSEMDVVYDWGGEESPFCAMSWGFADGEKEGSGRMYEIFGVKNDNNLEKDLVMNLHFSALRQGGEKAMKGEIAIEGNWDFSLAVHQTEGIHFSLEQEFSIAGYQVLVHEIIMSPISATIICDGVDIKEMEQGEGICLDQLDTLYPMLLNGIVYEDGSILDEEGNQDLSEGFLENGNYYKTFRLSSVAEVEKVTELLLGEQKDRIIIR